MGRRQALLDTKTKAQVAHLNSAVDGTTSWREWWQIISHRAVVVAAHETFAWDLEFLED